jgi:hypothetical protein
MRKVFSSFAGLLIAASMVAAGESNEHGKRRAI